MTGEDDANKRREVCAWPRFCGVPGGGIRLFLFFMRKDCVNDERPSGIFNEFLVQDLYEHRRVMEALASRMRVEDADDQLSGIGFATDKRAEVVVRVTGATERTLRVKF